MIPLCRNAHRSPGRKPTRVRAGPRRRQAFTLVELLVVIVIIGILAAVAIPQFGDSSTDAKVAALDQNLSCVRTAIELYYYQHNNTYPGVVKTSKAGASAVISVHTSAADAFAKQLTQYSNSSGDTSDAMSSDYPFGPYLRSGMPANPLPASSAAKTAAAVSVTTSTSPLTADNAPATGWKTSSVTGQFIANNSAYADR